VLYAIEHPEKPKERKPDVKLARVRTEAEWEQVRREIEELYGRIA
jgi:hypothetical protein